MVGNSSQESTHLAGYQLPFVGPLTDNPTRNFSFAQTNNLLD